MNNKKSNPELVDILFEHKRDIMLSFNCHAIGIVQSFDASTQTCRVSIAYEKTIVEQDHNGRYVSVNKPYPVLADVPVIVISGGGAGLTMPTSEGDSCVILYNDRDIDNWSVGATNGSPNSNRLHSLADAIAIVGLRPSGKYISGYDSVNPVLFNGTTKITVKADKIRLENVTFHLGALMEELMLILVAMDALTTTPSTQTAGINALKIKLQSLLGGIAP